MNEQARDFIHGMEDEGVSPSDDGTSQWALTLALATFVGHTESKEITSNK